MPIIKLKKTDLEIAKLIKEQIDQLSMELSAYRLFPENKRLKQLGVSQLPIVGKEDRSPLRVNINCDSYAEESKNIQPTSSSNEDHIKNRGIPRDGERVLLITLNRYDILSRHGFFFFAEYGDYSRLSDQ